MKNLSCPNNRKEDLLSYEQSTMKITMFREQDVITSSELPAMNDGGTEVTQSDKSGMNIGDL